MKLQPQESLQAQLSATKPLQLRGEVVRVPLPPPKQKHKEKEVKEHIQILLLQ